VFRLKDAVPLGELTAESIPRHLQSPLIAVADLPRLILDDAELNEICHGRAIDVSHRNIASGSETPHAEWAAVDGGGQLVAILQQKRYNQFWPILNFHRPARI
jgi:hypothetical protein